MTCSDGSPSSGKSEVNLHGHTSLASVSGAGVCPIGGGTDDDAVVGVGAALGAGIGASINCKPVSARA